MSLAQVVCPEMEAVLFISLVLSVVLKVLRRYFLYRTPADVGAGSGRKAVDGVTHGLR